MSAFTTPLRLEALTPGRWRLLERLVYESDRLGTIIVPEGFSTDLESIPRWLPVTFAVLRESAAAPAVVHDWAYWARQVGGRTLTREEADWALYEAALAVGVAPWRARLLWTGCRAGGWVVWAQRGG